MNTKFMGGTRYAQREIEMQRIPGFRPRKSGITVSRFSYTPAVGVCQNCALRAEKDNTVSATGILSRQEGFEGARVPFSVLLERLSVEVGVRPFADRVSHLTAGEAFFFDSDRHYHRFRKIWEAFETVPQEDAVFAALYLLSADTFLWGRSVMAVKADAILFQEIRIQGVDLKGYVLFHAARDLYKGTKHISLSELTDPELVSDEVFQLIVAAFLISRHGVGVACTERSRQ